jgi:hypothetical protein
MSLDHNNSEFCWHAVPDQREMRAIAGAQRSWDPDASRWDMGARTRLVAVNPGDGTGGHGADSENR